MHYRYKIQYKHRMCEDGNYITTTVTSVDTRTGAQVLRDQLNGHLDELYNALGEATFDVYYGVHSEYTIMPVFVKEVPE